MYVLAMLFAFGGCLLLIGGGLFPKFEPLRLGLGLVMVALVLIPTLAIVSHT